MYPKHLYKSPGPYKDRDGTYDVAGAADAEQEEALLARGWFASKRTAMGIEQAEALIEKARELDEALDEITAPTRDELEQKAAELGVSFNSRTRDEVLAQRIAEAIG